MILYLETSENEQVRLALIGPRKRVEISQHAIFDLSEKFPILIQKLLDKGKIKFSNLTAIAVVAGPGLFSRLRTAVVTANALAYALDLKIIPLSSPFDKLDYYKLLKKPKFQQIEPRYGKAPNITKGK
ncbi:MAG: hypothetical protein HY336_01930 [Candidatus Doudnabacteria bacterium]|nr:hypothetical protein [Candidatus Doudnabacteria bacterium]